MPVRTTRHGEVIGYDANNEAIFKEAMLPDSFIVNVTRDGFSVERTGPNGLEAYWMCWPKKGYYRIEGDCLIILRRDGRGFKGGLMGDDNPDWAALPMIKLMTYEIQ